MKASSVLTALGLIFDVSRTGAQQLQIDSLRIGEHVAVLAADSLRGRGTPSPELDLAAAYVARVMTQVGLEPLGDKSTHLQQWPYVERTLRGDRVEVRLGANRNGTALRYGTDCFFVSAGRPMFTGPVLFRGSIERDTMLDSSVKGRVLGYALGSADWVGPVHAAFRRLRSAGAL